MTSVESFGHASVRVWLRLGMDEVYCKAKFGSHSGRWHNHSLAMGAACVALRGATGQSSPLLDAPSTLSPRFGALPPGALSAADTDAEDVNREAARVGIDLRDDSFSHGHTYVSFGRVTGQPSSC